MFLDKRRLSLLLFCQAWMQASFAANSVNRFRKSGIWPLSMIVFAPRPWFLTVKNHPGLFHKAQHNPSATSNLKSSPAVSTTLNMSQNHLHNLIWFRTLGDGGRFYSLSHALPADLHVEIACRLEKSSTTPRFSTVKPGYNDSGLRNTSCITSDFCGTD
jgi:hypothetical protein